MQARRLLQRDALQEHSEVSAVPAAARLRTQPRHCPHPDQMGARRMYTIQKINYIIEDNQSNKKFLSN
jgi:hypothetical protein